MKRERDIVMRLDHVANGFLIACGAGDLVENPDVGTEIIPLTGKILRENNYFPIPPNGFDEDGSLVEDKSPPISIKNGRPIFLWSPEALSRLKRIIALR